MKKQIQKFVQGWKKFWKGYAEYSYYVHGQGLVIDHYKDRAEKAELLVQTMDQLIDVYEKIIKTNDPDKREDHAKNLKTLKAIYADLHTKVYNGKNSKAS